MHTTCIETAFFSNRHTQQAKKAFTFTFTGSEGKANDIIHISFFHLCFSPVMLLLLLLLLFTIRRSLLLLLLLLPEYVHCSVVYNFECSVHTSATQNITFLMSLSFFFSCSLCRSSLFCALSHSIFCSLFFLPNKLIEL